MLSAAVMFSMPGPGTATQAPTLPVEAQWSRLLDTSMPDGAADEPAMAMGAILPVKGRSLVLLSIPVEREQ